MQAVAHPSPSEVDPKGRPPRQQHAARKTELEFEGQRLGGISRLISTLRLVTFLGAAAIFFARGFGYLPWWFWWIAGILAAFFLGLVFWHARLDASERRVRAAIDFHKWALERIEGRFDAYPSRGDRFVSDAHPFTSDLGIFGPSSIFQLIDATHTRRSIRSTTRRSNARSTRSPTWCRVMSLRFSSTWPPRYLPGLSATPAEIAAGRR